MIDMIGVGPFITIPLIVGAMGGPQAMLGWILGAIFAMCDGLVWAELGAAMPKSGGSYNYLREIYGPRRLGRLISFLFIWQLSFSAPLSVASGAIGLAGYASYFWPGLEHQYADYLWELHVPLLGPLQVRWLMSGATFVAIFIVVLAVILLYRKITSIGWMSKLLLAGVLITIGLDHHRRIHPLRCRSRFQLSGRRFHVVAQFFSRPGIGHAHRHLRLLGLLQCLLSGR